MASHYLHLHKINNETLDTFSVHNVFNLGSILCCRQLNRHSDDENRKWHIFVFVNLSMARFRWQFKQKRIVSKIRKSLRTRSRFVMTRHEPMRWHNCATIRNRNYVIQFERALHPDRTIESISGNKFYEMLEIVSKFTVASGRRDLISMSTTIHWGKDLFIGRVCYVVPKLQRGFW